MPSVSLSDEDFTEGKIDILAMLVKAGLVASRGEARRALEQGGVTADGEKVTDMKATLTKEQIANGVVLRRGKKSYKKVTL
jgi:tyrosyl-tRNA synthetase